MNLLDISTYTGTAPESLSCEEWRRGARRRMRHLALSDALSRAHLLGPWGRVFVLGFTIYSLVASAWLLVKLARWAL